MAKMSAKRHLKELQTRLLIVAFFFILGATLAYQFREVLIPFLMNPLHGERLIYLNPAGGFTFIFLISIYAGIALAFPILLQQIYSFLRPALPTGAQKQSWKLIVASLLLLVSGLLFGYFIAVPNALEFLYSFADQYVDASLTAESYLNFMIAYTIGIGIVFQLPLLLMLIHWIRPLTPGGLMRSQRWVIVGAFIVAAIITPTPDPVNQAIIAVPVIIVYQIGVAAVITSVLRARRKAKRAAGAQRVDVAQTPIVTKPAAQPVTIAIEAVIVEQPTSVPAPARSIDGFRAQRISTPQRPIAPPLARTAVTTRSSYVPTRSIDGMRSPLQSPTA